MYKKMGHLFPPLKSDYRKPLNHIFYIKQYSSHQSQIIKTICETVQTYLRHLSECPDKFFITASAAQMPSYSIHNTERSSFVGRTREKLHCGCRKLCNLHDSVNGEHRTPNSGTIIQRCGTAYGTVVCSCGSTQQWCERSNLR